MIITGLGATPNDVIIRGDTEDRIFDVLGGGQNDVGFFVTARAGNLTINNMTLYGGRNPGAGPVQAAGGAIRNTGYLVVNNVVFDQNDAFFGNGGAIGSFNGVTFVTDSIFTDNTAQSFGGTISIEGGVFTMDNSSITNFEGETIDPAIGGGIAIVNPTSKAVIRNSLIANAWATARGGGIFVSGAVELYNTTITGNFARTHGGGIYINNNPFDPNSSRFPPETIIINSTIAFNKANGVEESDDFSPAEPVRLPDPGGGVYVRDGRIQIINSVITDNLNYDNVHTNCDFDPIADGLFSLGHNLSGDDTCNFTEPTDQINMPGQLQALADNGGASQTHAPIIGSALLNNANDEACHTASLTNSEDQRGFTRPATGCDIGAFETEAIDGGSATTNGNFQLDRLANAPPISYTLPLTTLRGQPFTGFLYASDPEGQPLTYKIVQNGQLGTASLITDDGYPNSFTYVPEPHIRGNDELYFIACDPSGLCSNPGLVSIYIHMGSNAHQISFEIKPSDGPLRGPNPNMSEITTISETEMRLTAPDVNYNFPLGVYFFRVTDIPTDSGQDNAEIILQIPNNGTIPTNAVVRKLDITGNWRTVPSVSDGTISTAVVDEDLKTITLTLVDNDIFDLNPTVGEIDDPIALGIPVNEEAIYDLSASSKNAGHVPGGIGLAFGLVFLVVLAWPLRLYMRK